MHDHPQYRTSGTVFCAGDLYRVLKNQLCFERRISVEHPSMFNHVGQAKSGITLLLVLEHMWVDETSSYS